MSIRIANVQISYRHDVEGEGDALAAMYGAVLGMERYPTGYIKIRRPDGRLPEIGFEDTPPEPRPQWPDPAHPAQGHLDISVADLDEAEALVVGLGASRLLDGGHWRVLADPVGHPFCIFVGDDPGRIARVVFDCADPGALRRFYDDLLGPEEAALIGFEVSTAAPPAWPDPDRPAQLHLDLDADDRQAAMARVEALGGVLLATMEMHSVYADPAGHPFCI